MGSPVRELDLEGNPAISERAFLYLFQFFIRGNVAPPVGNSLSSPFSLEQTPAPSASRDLEKLNLAGCISIAQDEPFAGLLQLLNSPSLDSLQFLNLSALPLGVKWQVPLCKAIRIHPSIRTLSLADTGLGTRSSGDEDDNTMACVVELLSSKNIVHLDLSWNCFGSVGFDFLGAETHRIGHFGKTRFGALLHIVKEISMDILDGAFAGTFEGQQISAKIEYFWKLFGLPRCSCTGGLS